MAAANIELTDVLTLGQHQNVIWVAFCLTLLQKLLEDLYKFYMLVGQRKQKLHYGKDQAYTLDTKKS